MIISSFNQNAAANSLCSPSHTGKAICSDYYYILCLDAWIFFFMLVALKRSLKCCWVSFQIFLLSKTLGICQASYGACIVCTQTYSIWHLQMHPKCSKVFWGFFLSVFLFGALWIILLNLCFLFAQQAPPTCCQFLFAYPINHILNNTFK